MMKRPLLGILLTGGLIVLAGLPFLAAQHRVEIGRARAPDSPDLIKIYWGRIVRVDDDLLFVSLSRGRRVIIRVPDDAKISLDHRTAELDDLEVGMRVRGYAAPRVRVTGPTSDRGDSKVTRSKDTSRSSTRGEGGVIPKAAFKGITAVNWVAIRIEARSAGRSHKK
jgi:hypothetical protein